jgi:hypothetical protein
MSGEFWLRVGDRVQHVKDASWRGKVVSIDSNLIESHGVTTCRVLWDDSKDPDIHWTNKLVHEEVTEND